MKHSSCLSLPVCSVKYDNPSQRRRLLHLLEAEEAVTRMRMAEVLGISRMTAHRMAEQFISQGLMAEIIGRDPISGRKSHLLTPAPEPPLLLLDVWEEAPSMKAYLYDGGKIRQIHADYRLTTDVVGNELTLCELAKSWWYLSHDTTCVVLRRHDGSARLASLPFKDMYVLHEDVAIAHALDLHLTPKPYRSLLHLRTDPHISAALYVRAQHDAPWFVPSGALLTFLPLHTTEPSSTDAEQISGFIKTYCQYINPDVILWEDNVPYAARGRSAFDEPFSCGHKLLLAETDSQVTAILRQADLHLPVLIYKRKFPLWVTGAISLRREMLWLDTQPFLPY